MFWITIAWMNWHRSFEVIGKVEKPTDLQKSNSSSSGKKAVWIQPDDTTDDDTDIGFLKNMMTTNGLTYKKLTSEDQCFYIARYACKSTFWGSIQGDTTIRVGEGEKYKLTVVPSRNDSFYLSKCKSNTYLVIGEAGIPQFVGNGKGSELSIYEQPFGVDGGLVIGMSGDTVRSMGVVANIFIRYVEHHDIATRLDAVWSFISVSKPVMEYPKWIHILKGSTHRKANVTTNGPGCIRKFRGCCFLKRKVPAINILNKGDSGIPKGIAALVVSSLVTLPRRLYLLEKSLFNKKSIDVVITTDCHISFLQSRLEGNVAAWLIGPSAHFLKDFIEINLRVTLSVHWMFRNLHKDWYFIVDDDTLVFADNLRWVLRAFPDPQEQYYYVGHTSEWNEKTMYHGDMPFGGGGIAISAAIRNNWIQFFRRENPSRDWLASGHWSHSGGDGAVCRLTSWVMSNRGEDRIFTEVRGFHQLDILGNQGIEDILKKECPLCPSELEQPGAWFDDVISAQPVITLHHMGVISRGSLFPNVSGDATIPKLFSSYNSLPNPLLFLRRHCFEISDYTTCINFGRSVQIYKGITPEKAMSPLKKESAVGKDAPEKMLRMSLVQAVELSLLGTTYWNENSNKNRQEYSASVLTPDQTFTKAITTFSSNAVEVSLHFADSPVATATIDISHLLSPSTIAINNKEFDTKKYTR